MRFGAVLALVAALLVALAPPAAAHVSGGNEASDYVSTVTSTVPPGLLVTLSPDGEELTAEVRAGTLEVPGYSGEPYLSISADGVRRNQNSPATYLNVDAGGDAALPARADPTAAPDWVVVSDRPAFTWHDHRTHWMGSQLPEPVAADRGSAHLIAQWQVPLTYDGRSLTLDGTLRWEPPPNSLPLTVAVAALAVLGVAAGGRSVPALRGLLTVAWAAELVHLLLGGWPAEDPVFGLVQSAVPLLAAGVLLAVSWRAPTSAPYAVGLGAVVVLLSGLSDLTVLTHSQIPGPALLTRTAVVLTLGLGAGVALGSLRALRRMPQPAPV